MMLSQPIATEESEWPKTWILTDEVKDVNPESVQNTLDLAGIACWRMGNEAFRPPSIPSVSWNYQVDTSQSSFAEKVNGPNYKCAKVISLSLDDHLVDYATEDLQPSFVKQLYDGTRKICYVLVGSGLFDIECDGDKRLRVHVKKGDLITFPEDIYHHFTADEEDIRCNRNEQYFAGQLVTGPLVRIIVESRRDTLKSSRPLSPRTTIC